MQISNANILKASLTDAYSLNELINSAYRGESSKHGWTTEADLLSGTRTTVDLLEEILCRNDTTVFKYQQEGRTLGCVELRIEGQKVYLGMLTVSPKLQGQGIGKILLEHSERFVKENGLHCIYMTVISIRQELVDWYIRCGYKFSGKTKPFNVPDKRWGIPNLPIEFLVLEKEV